MQLNTFPLVLHDSFMITKKVKHFIFKITADSIFHYIPGQFITLHFEHEGKLLKRSYSIANPPEGNNCIELAAGYFPGGPGTSLLFNLKPGDSIQASGPYGRLVLKEHNPKRYVLVATSTGVTPYRAMLTELGQRMQQQADLATLIVLGVQYQEDLLYHAEFKQFTQQFPQATFIPCLSKENAQALKSGEQSGYVQQLFPQLNLNPEQDFVYLCGNPSMIDEAFNYLKAQGFSMDHIVREKYISR
ncbi:MAG: ferredoxin--NADP(+) reductase [Legionella sp.]|nr:MAG: ferredoxin--NADP(+) reductase [Legionella sp.]